MPDISFGATMLKLFIAIGVGLMTLTEIRTLTFIIVINKERIKSLTFPEWNMYII